MSDTEQPQPIKDILEHEVDSLKKESTGRKKHGGKRKGAGRRAGSMNKATMETKTAKKLFIDRVNQHVDELFNAQLSLAKGEQVLMVQITRGKGKDRKRWHEQVTDAGVIKQYLDDENSLNSDEEFYYITTRPANNMAIDSLLNRSFGKATEKVELEGGLFKASQLTIKVVKTDGHDRAGTGTEREAGDSSGTTE